MKPVCEYPNYCRNDKKALYIGQQSYIAFASYRKINSWFPSGWSSISSNWDGLCGYTGNANGNSALCNVPINTHAWRTPGQYNPGFICGAKTVLGNTIDGIWQNENLLGVSLHDRACCARSPTRKPGPRVCLRPILDPDARTPERIIPMETSVCFERGACTLLCRGNRSESAYCAVSETVSHFHVMGAQAQGCARAPGAAHVSACGKGTQGQHLGLGRQAPPEHQRRHVEQRAEAMFGVRLPHSLQRA